MHYIFKSCLLSKSQFFVVGIIYPFSTHNKIESLYTTYRHNLGILCQGREGNPIHTDVFNELIENLKEKNPTWNKATFNYERPVTRTLFMEENSDGDR